MPVLKLSLSDDEIEKLQMIMESDAFTAQMTIQDFIRFKLLGQTNAPAPIFTPEEAVRRAWEKFTPEQVFTLPDIYGEEWALLNPRMTGVFGKRFFKHVESIDSVEFIGMVDRGRRASYRIKREA